MRKLQSKNESASVAKEITKRLNDYKTNKSLDKKLKAASALSLLALISSVPDDSEANRLLKLLKDIER